MKKFFLVIILICFILIFSIKGVSIVGAVIHNIAQILTAVVILGSAGILFYLPVLLIAGTVAGLVIGILGAVMVPMIKMGFCGDIDR